MTKPRGRWIDGGPWERFGLYNAYVLTRTDGARLKIPAHAGELVPGSTEDLLATLATYDPSRGRPTTPMTLELDPTFACASRDCGGACFSAEYRSRAPSAAIATDVLVEVIESFAEQGGRIIRFDGGGDPLSHPAVRDGRLPGLASERGLASTILTSGDLLHRADLARLAEAGCYVRVSLNAAREGTRRRFHGNTSSLDRIFGSVRSLRDEIDRAGTGVPVGATYLLSRLNHEEVVACAERAREAGIEHFSVRRVLGPDALRSAWTEEEERRVENAFEQLRAMHGVAFRVFVPWRRVTERDPVPRDFGVTRCWQSTFKTIMEPSPVGAGAARLQLCGRYRGSGVGQQQQRPPLAEFDQGSGWVARWRASFEEYETSREELPRTCVSCIDRGFMVMIDRMIQFSDGSPGALVVRHLDSPEPSEVEAWEAVSPSSGTSRSNS